MRKILVIGVAGLIGFYLWKRLIEQGDKIIGVKKPHPVDGEVHL